MARTKASLRQPPLAFAGTDLLEPGTKPYGLAPLLIRLFRSLDAVVASDEVSLHSWM